MKTKPEKNAGKEKKAGEDKKKGPLKHRVLVVDDDDVILTLAPQFLARKIARW